MTLHSAADIRAAVVNRQTTPDAFVSSALDRIEALDHQLHSFVTVCEEHAMTQVENLERRVAAGEQPGPLWGVPFSVKDIFDTAAVRTTYGSRVFERHKPEADAEIVTRVRRAGGVLVGKTNTPEFAIYIRTVNDLQPETLNPWDRERTSGGSSGGSAASVAAGLTPVAVGSDGGGSVRVPAALCGLVGLMPSRGSIPRGGGRIGTRRFSAAGPMAVEAKDALTLWRVMKGPSPNEPLSRGLYPTGVTHRPIGSHTPRLRWVGESGVEGADSVVVDAVYAAAESFAQALEAPLDVPETSIHAPRFADDFYAMMQADRLSTGGREILDDPVSSGLLTGYARHHFEQAVRVDGAAYSAALETQLTATEHLVSLMDGVDVLLTPTVGLLAPKIPGRAQSLPEDARRSFVAFTFLMNYAGFPAATVPCGLVHGLPIGLQIVGRPGADEELLRLCDRFQETVCRLPAIPLVQRRDEMAGVSHD